LAFTQAGVPAMQSNAAFFILILQTSAPLAQND